MIKIYKYAEAYKGKLYKFQNEDKNALLAEVHSFFKKNNINFSNDLLLKAIDRQSKIKINPGKVTFQSAISGAMAVIRYTTGSSVSTAEMIRRSDICARCPMLSQISTCMACGGAGKIARFINGIRAAKKVESSIPSEVKASYCGVCSCSLALMVVTKIKDFHTESEAENRRRPDVCWLKTTSTNFKNE